MGRADIFPMVLDREGVEQLIAKHIDPDAERFRYFAAAFMSAANDTPSPQAQTLREIVELQQPATIDELRNCIDAAKVLSP